MFYLFNFNIPRVCDLHVTLAIPQPLYGLFWGETGNGVWKRKADSAFHHCKTFKSLMEETIMAIPDSVLDSPPVDPYSTACIDKFANSKNLLPSPYTVEEEQEEQLLYA